MSDEEAIRLFWRLAPLALLAGVIIGLLTANIVWVPGHGYATL